MTIKQVKYAGNRTSDNSVLGRQGKEKDRSQRSQIRQELRLLVGSSR